MHSHFGCLHLYVFSHNTDAPFCKSVRLGCVSQNETLANLLMQRRELFNNMLKRETTVSINYYLQLRQLTGELVGYLISISVTITSTDVPSSSLI